jgi:uncharacterized protein
MVGGELELHRNDLEISFFEGEGFMVEDLIFEQLLLALPHKKLCREDCKGLCQICGVNRNVKECMCVTNIIDPRLEVLKKLIDDEE